MKKESFLTQFKERIQKTILGIFNLSFLTWIIGNIHILKGTFGKVSIMDYTWFTGALVGIKVTYKYFKNRNGA